MREFHQFITRDTNLSIDIGGYDKDIMGFTRGKIYRYLNEQYQRENCLICIGGNLEKEYKKSEIVKMVRDNIHFPIVYGDGKLLKKNNKKRIIKNKNKKRIIKNKNKKRIIKNNKRIIRYKCREIKKYIDGPYYSYMKKYEKQGVHTSIIKQKLSQGYFVFGFPAYNMQKKYTKKSYVLDLIGTILAGNMSSRLFILLREKYGLVYTIHFDYVMFEDIGYIYFYGGTQNDRQHIELVIKLFEEEIEKIKTEGLKDDEIERTRQYIMEGIKMTREENNIYNYAEEYLMTGKYTSLDEEYRIYKSITKKEIEEVIEEIFRWNRYYRMIMTDKKIKMGRGEKF
jgi:predicted Zn-dependent peptidase